MKNIGSYGELVSHKIVDGVYPNIQHLYSATVRSGSAYRDLRITLSEVFDTNIIRTVSRSIEKQIRGNI